MMRIILTFTCFLSVCSAIAQPTAFSGCPSVNTAVVRSGTNANNTNPYSIYTVDATTGAPTLVSGPILNPANTAANLQINGVGLNTKDGFMYGLNSDQPTVAFSFPIIPNIPYYRLGANAVAEQLGTIAGPAVAGAENASIVSAAAGEVNQLDEYYFSASTGIVVPNVFTPTASTFTPTRLFIGKLTNISGLSAGTGALSPTYVPITNPSGDASVYLSNVFASITLSTSVNTGLRDFVYDQTDNLLVSYVTFPDASNPSGNYYGQMLKVNPTTGVLTAVAPAVILPFATASNEMAGTFIDKDGNFIILFTDGKMYKANLNASGTFDGSISLINGATGLPNQLRGDMSSCGNSKNAAPLPITLLSFNVYKQNSEVVIKWQTTSEINVDKFIIEKSTDATNWISVSQTVSNGNLNNGSNYQFIDNGTFQTSFYRLVTIDKNGVKRYSSVKKIVANPKTISYSTYPNPVNSILNIEGQQVFGANTAVEILDVTGKVMEISNKKVADNTVKLNVSKLSNGVYFIRITSNTGVSTTQRFIKE